MVPHGTVCYIITIILYFVLSLWSHFSLSSTRMFDDQSMFFDIKSHQGIRL
jgi:hypothetical protein